MSREARPIVNAYLEEGRKHPEGGEKFSNALNKRVEEIKKQSIEEKKQGCLAYRGRMIWADLNTPEEFEKKYLEVVEGYKNGSFFIERIGRHREVDYSLTAVLVHLRKQWVKDYEIATAPEYMLLDMALTSYSHFIRLNEAVNNVMASIEWDYFAMEAPRFTSANLWGNTKLYGKKDDKAVAEELAHRLTEVLQPTLDQYNRMFIRNLKAIRDLKRGNIQLNIGNVRQMNVGDKQINVERGVAQ
jgi:hypothetical protein